MGKTVKFRGDHAKIKIQGREPVTSENLTYEKYEWLVKLDPRYEAFFEVTDNKPKKDDNIQTKKKGSNDLGVSEG